MSDRRLPTRLVVILAAAAAAGVVAVPTSPDVPWYASAVLACALSAGVGLFSWGVAFVVETKRRLAIIERALNERSTES
jgi:CHASE2 domain-containing sensor protein